MSKKDLMVRGEGQAVEVHQGATDDKVISMWLYGRSRATLKAYSYEVEALMAAVGKPLATVTLGDLQGYFTGLTGLAPATQARAIAAVKSLFSFAKGIGYVKYNPAKAIKSPRGKNGLAERILPEAQVYQVIALEPNVRNRALLRLLYAGGLRVSEICGLTWGDCGDRDGAGQITIFGKGGRTRHVLLSADTWAELMQLKGDAGGDAPVFISRHHGHLHPSQAWRIVKAAVARAGIEAPVSPHWFRHAHASHALDRGCPIHLVQATLGTPASPPRANISMPGQMIARPVTWPCRGSDAEEFISPMITSFA